MDDVLKVCLKIPKGYVVTYKEVGRVIGSKAYRAIGTKLRKNPYAPKVPCHRVIRSDLYVGNYAGSTNNSKKISLLRSEGVEIVNGKVLEKYVYKFKKIK